MQPCSSARVSSQSAYWMRAVKFSAMHRILKTVAACSRGLEPSELDARIRGEAIMPTLRSAVPSRTTCYHHRNTMIRLGLLKREGRKLLANKDNLHVGVLLRVSTRECELDEFVREKFGTLILQNEECRSLFFNLFMPVNQQAFSLSEFWRHGRPVEWKRGESVNGDKVVFQNFTTGRKAVCRTHGEVEALLYGLRYWARDELRLIDEYCQKAGMSTVMFPVTRPDASAHDIRRTANIVLSMREGRDSTVLAVAEMIKRCCVDERQPVQTLYDAIDLLLGKWGDHIALIPTSRRLATLCAGTREKEELALRGYYKPKDGPYISHIRLYSEIPDCIREVSEHDWRIATVRA